VKIVLRADSGFAREALMAWCEASKVVYVFGLARNERLQACIAEAEGLSLAGQGKPARVFRDSLVATKQSWSRRRRVIAKAEWTGGEANSRFVVTPLRPDAWLARALHEDLYCARGEMEKPDQGAPGRSVRPPPVGGDHARQSVCGCGFPRWPTFSSARCAASASPIPSSPPRPAPPSASSSSSSARWSRSVRAASRSPWPPPVHKPTNGGSSRRASPTPAARRPDTRRPRRAPLAPLPRGPPETKRQSQKPSARPRARLTHGRAQTPRSRSPHRPPKARTREICGLAKHPEPVR
jgi:hypothetical protein